MRLDLSAARLKLERADHHLKALQTLLDTYIRYNEHRIETVQEEGVPGLTVLAYFDRPLPPEVPGLVGDALANLRTSLDCLAVAAIVSNHVDPDQSAHFPICPDELKFEKQIGIALKGASPSFVAHIRTLRPYLNELDSRLYVLEHLLGLDRQRPLRPRVDVFAVLNLEVTDASGNTLMTMGEINTRGSQSINPQSLGGAGLRYGTNSSARFGIVFANTNFLDGHEVLAVLLELQGRVAEIVGQFDGAP
ncbi:hypothetical protein EYC98_13800 [Halieaceae bacterium IMCC14734]|uniref:Uncharacterized protein n=1 Tax=Candidatus Litorirhabdus singularis TaxID=2518993 RepID=A0ABT3TJI0_9GAMM|nr:hypothetical protein [Candidatus Litorirhabdus singularis]MCX2981931.1 hypothetical protein [Candidatus Litorirhabdus singularis]